MAGPQADSGTTLPGQQLGGDVIRDVTVTRSDGTSAKQQTVTVADPTDPAGVQRVAQTGEASVVEEDLREILRAVLRELRALRLVLQGQTGETLDFNNALESLEEVE